MESIYFIAILPPEKIQDEITVFKQYAAEKFNTKRALTSPPHVTLVAPFKLEDKQVNDVVKAARYIALQQTNFDIELKDFNCFAPRVIYADVMTSEKLDHLYFSLNQHLENECGIEFRYKEQTYHPHMTVAFKDLKEAMFPKAWKYFRRAKYKEVFEANAFIVLKHDGKQWQIYKEIAFK